MSYVITAKSLSKSFNRRVIIDNLSFEFYSPTSVAILGANGSGKTTLLSLITGKISPTSGSIQHQVNGLSIEVEDYYQYISWVSPNIELYPYLSLKEACELHFRFKSCLLAHWVDCLDYLQLTPYLHQPLKELSSGMLQRFKVGLGLFSKSAVLLLDEPTSFMDVKNSRLVLDLIDQYAKDRIYILASNIPEEYERVSNSISLGI